MVSAAHRMLAGGGRVIPAAPVSGYFAWYDANQITGVADGATLATWPDMSGNGYDLSQITGGTTSNDPTYYKTTAGKLINGKPAVWFSAASTQMLINAQLGLILALANSRAYMFFFVAQDLSAASATKRTMLDLSGDLVEMTNVSNTYRMAAGALLASAPGAEDTNLHAYCYEYDAGSTGSLYIDSTSIASGTTGSNTGVSNASYAICLGGQPASNGTLQIPGYGWDGPICEGILYAGVAAGDMAAMKSQNFAYLKAKWGTP